MLCSYFTDSTHCLVAILLNALIIPSRNKTNKPTIKTAIDVFIIKVNNLSDIPEKVEKYEKENDEKGPFIIVVGDDFDNLTDFYIAFDGTFFKAKSFLECLDTCFKIFFVCHLKYPEVCYGLWLFIQKYFYNISTSNDKNNSKAATLINYLSNSKT